MQHQPLSRRELTKGRRKNDSWLSSQKSNPKYIEILKNSQNLIARNSRQNYFCNISNITLLKKEEQLVLFIIIILFYT